MRKTMKRGLALVSLSMLAACQQSDPGTQKRMADLEARVAKLEAKATDADHKVVVSPLPASQFELVGLTGTRRMYDDLPTCQSAIAAIKKDWQLSDQENEQRAEAMASRIVASGSRPSISCIPAD